MQIKRETFWGIIITALCTAFITVMGWIILEIIDLKNKQAVAEAEDDLRDKITDVFNDIDKRMAVIEAINQRSNTNIPTPVMVPYSSDPLPEPLISESAEQFDGPRYDLRKRDE